MFLKKNMATPLRLFKLHLNEIQNYQAQHIRTDTIVVEHGGGAVMVWACFFAAAGPELLAVTEGLT